MPLDLYCSSLSWVCFKKKVLRPKTWNLFWFVDPRHGTHMGGLCETCTQHAQIRALFCNFLGPQVAGNSLLFASDQLVDCGKMNVPLATAAVQVLVTYCTATACVGRAMVTQPGHQIDSVCIPFAYVLPHCWNQLADMTWDFCKFWKYSVSLSKQLWKMDLYASFCPMFLPDVTSIW